MEIINALRKLLSKIEGLQEEVEALVCRGEVASLEEYRGLVGKLNAYQDVYDIIEETINAMKEDNDEQ